jgi:hypothetical protein
MVHTQISQSIQSAGTLQPICSSPSILEPWDFDVSARACCTSVHRCIEIGLTCNGFQIVDRRLVSQMSSTCSIWWVAGSPDYTLTSVSVWQYWHKLYIYIIINGPWDRITAQNLDVVNSIRSIWTVIRNQYCRIIQNTGSRPQFSEPPRSNYHRSSSKYFCWYCSPVLAQPPPPRRAPDARRRAHIMPLPFPRPKQSTWTKFRYVHARLPPCLSVLTDVSCTTQVDGGKSWSRL